METVDLIFKHGKEVKEHIHKLVVLNEDIVESLENITDIPFSVIISGCNKKRWVEILKKIVLWELAAIMSAVRKQM